MGGGAGRCASIFGPDASLLATLRGHTGWVRDLLFHEGQLYSHLAGSSNIGYFALGGGSFQYLTDLRTVCQTDWHQKERLMADLPNPQEFQTVWMLLGSWAAGIGCNVIKVWRPQEEGDAAARWRSCMHVGDLEVGVMHSTATPCSCWTGYLSAHPELSRQMQMDHDDF